MFVVYGLWCNPSYLLKENNTVLRCFDFIHNHLFITSFSKSLNLARYFIGQHVFHWILSQHLADRELSEGVFYTYCYDNGRVLTS